MANLLSWGRLKDNLFGTNNEAGKRSIDAATQKLQQAPQYGKLAANQTARNNFYYSQNQGNNLNLAKAAQLSAFQAPGRVLPAYGLGAARSLTGTAEGLSGLVDLLSPGTGTNRFTQGLVRAGAGVDQFARSHNVDPATYRAGQATTDALSFLAPSAAAGAVGKAGKVGKVLSSTDPLIGARGLKYVSTPANLLNTAVATTRAQGGVSARGKDVSAQSVALAGAANLALGGALNVAGAKIADPVSKKLAGVRNSSELGGLLKEQAIQKAEVSKLRASSGATSETRLRELRREMAHTDARVKEVKQGGGVPIGSPLLPVSGKKNSLPDVNLKDRGFKGNMQKANVSEKNTTAEQVIASISGYKPITNRQTLGKAASEINKDASSAYARIITKPQLTSAQDVATGNLLLRQAIESEDTEAAIQIGTKLGIDATKLGQAAQAYAMWNKTTPEGIVRFASKQARLAGKDLDPGITKELVTTAKNIAAMPDGLEKAKATRALLNQAENINKNWKDSVQQVVSAPRSMMATADLSAPLRQGAILGSRYPKQFASNFKDMVTYFGKPKAYEQAMYDISQRPSYALMKSHKLAVDGARGITGTEEQFMSSILEGKVAKKLGFGHLVAASDRAYTGFLTKFRADVFDKVVSESGKAGVKLDKPALDSLTKFINSASGRGSGKNLDRYGGLLSQALFSPRLWKSRIDTLNPAYYARLDPAARKLALQSAASFLAVTSTVLGLAKAAGAEVGTDPRSADFAKVKVGNTRYDVLGGLQQNARLAAQMISGQKVNSETGEVQTLGPDRGFGKPSRLDLAYQFLENKENPVVGVASKLLRGTDPVGNKINPATEIGKLAVPLNLQGAYETAVDQNSLPKGVAMNLPGTFGIGVQTYGKKGPTAPTSPNASPKDVKTSTSQELAAVKDANIPGYDLRQLDDGSYSYSIDGKVSNTSNLKKARRAIAEDAFGNTNANIKVIGETVLRKNADGSITPTTKTKFDYQLGTATLTSQKNAGNLQGWFQTADKQLQSIQKQLQSPNIDPLDAITLQNQAQALLDNAAKYQEYGGFTKPKAAKKFSYPSLKTASIKIAKPKGISVRKPAAFKAPSTRKLAVSKLPSSYLKRKLA